MFKQALIVHVFKFILFAAENLHFFHGILPEDERDEIHAVHE